MHVVGSHSGVGQGDFSEMSRLQQNLESQNAQLTAKNDEIMQLVRHTVKFTLNSSLEQYVNEISLQKQEIVTLQTSNLVEIESSRSFENGVVGDAISSRETAERFEKCSYYFELLLTYKLNGKCVCTSG